MALSGITSAENTSSQSTVAVAAVNVSVPTAEVSSNTSRTVAASVTLSETVDTVTLQNKSQKNVSESRTEKAKIEENKTNSTVRSASDVLFDYNAKGDLRIKFMDSHNKLIYQTPPVLFARISDLMTQSQSTVDTKV